jgi:hypothetical protein
MKYFQAGTLLFLAGFPAPIVAENFLPPTQDAYFEMAAAIMQQEAPGLRWSLAYLTNMGIPSIVSKVGLDLGFQFFDAISPFALEYGFFLESTIYASSSYTAHLKTGVYTLTFPEGEASETSMSSVAIEPFVQWDHKGMFWELGIGARYRDKDPERIEVGSQTIEKQWLFYPKLGLGTSF